MLNFIDSLSRKNKLFVFCIEDDKVLQIENQNIEYFKYRVKKTWYKKIIKHSFFWLLHKPLRNIVQERLTESDVDLIICHDLPSLSPAIELKYQLNAPLLYDSLEIYTETINQFFPGVHGVKKIITRFLIKFMRYFGAIAEGRMMKSCDSITTVNSSLATYFKMKYNQNNIDVIMNCPRSIANIDSSINFRSMYGFSNEDSVFIYQGVLNEGRGLNLLVEAFEYVSIKNKNIKLIVLGDGVLRKVLKKKVTDIEKNL